MKFCTTCQSSQPEEGGYKKPNSPRGWICKGCNEKIHASIYKSKRKATAQDVNRLMAAVYGKRG